MCLGMTFLPEHRSNVYYSFLSCLRQRLLNVRLFCFAPQLPFGTVPVSPCIQLCFPMSRACGCKFFSVAVLLEIWTSSCDVFQLSGRIVFCSLSGALSCTHVERKQMTRYKIGHEKRSIKRLVKFILVKCDALHIRKARCTIRSYSRAQIRIV